MVVPISFFMILQGPGSPYNSPIGRGSPLLSPLPGDPAGFKALNLDPSCPQVPDDVYRFVFYFRRSALIEYLFECCFVHSSCLFSSLFRLIS